MPLGSLARLGQLTEEDDALRSRGVDGAESSAGHDGTHAAGLAGKGPVQCDFAAARAGPVEVAVGPSRDFR